MSTNNAQMFGDVSQKRKAVNRCLPFPINTQTRVSHGIVCNEWTCTANHNSTGRGGVGGGGFEYSRRTGWS